MKAIIIALLLQLGWGWGYPAVQPPPARFDHPQKQAWSVNPVPQPKLYQVCKGPCLACTYVGAKVCITFIDERFKNYDLLRRHERAHCNGWPANHPY